MNTKKYHIFCDESGIVKPDLYFCLGGVLVESKKVFEIEKEIIRIKGKWNKSNHEMKFHKLKNWQNYNLYKEIIEEVFLKNEIDFRCTIFNTNEINHSIYNQKNLNGASLTKKYDQSEQGFYKLYYTMIDCCILRININSQFNLYIDERPNHEFSDLNLNSLKICLNSKSFLYDTFPIVEFINSRKSEISQLCDLLLGSISYCKNNRNSKKPYKTKFIQMLEEKINIKKISNTTYSNLKWKIFNCKFKRD